MAPAEQVAKVRPVRVAAIDRHPVTRAGLAAGLRSYGFVVGTIAGSIEAFYDGTEEIVDVVLLDVDSGDESDPVANVVELTDSGYSVLLFTQERRQHLLARCLGAGASGAVSKLDDLSTLAHALRRVANGASYLSDDWADSLTFDGRWLGDANLTMRETEAVRLYSAGMKLTSVARRLRISPDTARTYLLRARSKYADVGRPATTKTELYIRAVEDGLLPQPDATCEPLAISS